MSRMGDVLAGINAVWEFDADAVLIRFGRGLRGPRGASRLLQVLGERRVPYDALAGAEVQAGPGRRGSVVLRAVPREGADPVMEVAAGQLCPAADPYRLVLPPGADSAVDATAYAARLEALAGPPVPADRHLVAAPEPPRAFKAYDARVSFDGGTVVFRWSPTGAPSAKWKAGDQSFPVAGLCGVEWRTPDAGPGHLRVLPRDAGAECGEPGTLAAAPEGPPAAPELDPHTVLIGSGYGPVHESLPLAAAVLAAVRRAGAARVTRVPPR
jgi:hypothetical protein